MKFSLFCSSSLSAAVYHITRRNSIFWAILLTHICTCTLTPHSSTHNRTHKTDLAFRDQSSSLFNEKEMNRFELLFTFTHRRTFCFVGRTFYCFLLLSEYFVCCFTYPYVQLTMNRYPIYPDAIQ